MSSTAAETIATLEEHVSTARERCAENHNYLIETIGRHGWADEITIGGVMNAQEISRAARAVENVLQHTKALDPEARLQAVRSVIGINFRASLTYGRSSSVLSDHAGSLAADAWARLASIVGILP
jgi:hypothetical protein